MYLCKISLYLLYMPSAKGPRHTGIRIFIFIVVKTDTDTYVYLRLTSVHTTVYLQEIKHTTCTEPFFKNYERRLRLALQSI